MRQRAHFRDTIYTDPLFAFKRNAVFNAMCNEVDVLGFPQISPSLDCSEMAWLIWITVWGLLLQVCDQPRMVQTVGNPAYWEKAWKFTRQTYEELLPWIGENWGLKQGFTTLQTESYDLLMICFICRKRKPVRKAPKVILFVLCLCEGWKQPVTGRTSKIIEKEGGIFKDAVFCLFWLVGGLMLWF